MDGFTLWHLCLIGPFPGVEQGTGAEMMWLVLLKFLLLQSAPPSAMPSAALLPVAMPFWVVSPVPEAAPRRWRESASVKQTAPSAGLQPPRTGCPLA